MNVRTAPSDPRSSMRDRMEMYSGNALKIGLFGSNCSSGRCVTNVPERWTGNWEDNLALARMCDANGIEFMLPVGRWKGYGGDTDYMGTTLETITWATGLLGKTKNLIVFGTVHAPLFNPIIAAKEFVTVDHIGEGRFGINLVVGWNEGEFEMFGVSQREHDDRYEYAQEWLDVIKRAWSEHTDFDFAGQYLKLKGVRAFPKPYGDTRPVIMNAGRSGVGQAFALKNCDAFFTATVDSRNSIEANAKKVEEIKSAARAIGREIDVYTVGQVVCRPTQKEAEDYYRHAQIENADWGAIEKMMALKNITRQTVTAEVFAQQQQYFAGKAIGGYPFVGTPDRVAEELANISSAGMRGIAVSFVNYLNETPYFCDEVLPRLARLGIRQSH